MEKFYIFTFLLHFANNLILPFISLYLYSLNIPVEVIGRFISILNFSSVFGFIASIFLSKYKNVSFTIFQISLFIYGISILFLFYSKSYILLFFSILSLSIAGGIFTLLYQWFLVSNFKKTTVFSFENLTYAIAYILSTIISGILIKNYGFSYLIFLLSFSSILFSLLILSQLKLKIVEEKFEFFISEEFKKFLIIFSLFYFSVGIASPYFSIFIVRNLNLSALEWSIVGIVEMVSFILFFSSILKIFKKYSTKTLLFFSTFLISTIPFFWVITKNYLLILLYSIISGIAWRIFSIGTYSFISKVVKSKFEIGLLSFLSSLFLSLGSLFSSIILHFFPFSSVFYVSFIFRLFSSFLFLTLKKEKIDLKEIKENFVLIFKLLKEIFIVFPIKSFHPYNRNNRIHKSLQK
jgi:MFS family permease